MVLIHPTFDTVCQHSRWLDVVEVSSSGANMAMCWFAGGGLASLTSSLVRIMNLALYVPACHSISEFLALRWYFVRLINFWRKCKILFYVTGFLASIIHCLITLTSSLLWWIMNLSFYVPAWQPNISIFGLEMIQGYQVQLFLMISLWLNKIDRCLKRYRPRTEANNTM